jgi:hypothetical protein
VLLQQPLARQVEQHQRFVMLERPLQQPEAQRRGVGRPGITEPKAVLDFAKVVGSGVLAVAILSQCFAGDAQLQGQVRDGSRWRAAEVVRDEAQVRQRLEPKRMAKAVVVAAAIADHSSRRTRRPSARVTPP